MLKKFLDNVDGHPSSGLFANALHEPGLHAGLWRAALVPISEEEVGHREAHRFAQGQKELANAAPTTQLSIATPDVSGWTLPRARENQRGGCRCSHRSPGAARCLGSRGARSARAAWRAVLRWQALQRQGCPVSAQGPDRLRR